MKIVLCAILRVENRYLEEWLDYHLSLGFDHIYLCDNAQDGEEHAEEVIANNEKKYEGRITIFPYFNKKAQQVKAYTDCYNRKDIDFDWMAFVDIDEFITFAPDSKYGDIHQFVTDLQDADEILLNWRMYDDNGLVKDDGRGVLERFVKPLPSRFSPYNLTGKKPLNCTVKQILKRGMQLQSVMPHASVSNQVGGVKCVDADGNAVHPVAVQPRYTFKTCYVRHFYTKTIEEYLATKIARGTLVSREGHYEVSHFFLYNRITPQKLAVYRNALTKYGSSTPPFSWWVKQLIKNWLITPFMIGEGPCKSVIRQDIGAKIWNVVRNIKSKKPNN